MCVCKGVFTGLYVPSIPVCVLVYAHTHSCFDHAKLRGVRQGGGEVDNMDF